MLLYFRTTIVRLTGLIRGLGFKHSLAALAAVFLILLTLLLFPPSNFQEFSSKEIVIKPGMGLDDIASLLYEEQLIQSTLVFKLVALVTGKAFVLRPGVYVLESRLSYLKILTELTSGGGEEITIVIPEGATIFDIDALLSEHNVIETGELMEFNKQLPPGYEGYFFPDTYRFLIGSGAEVAAHKMLHNFNKKAAPLFKSSDREEYKTLILASLIEKEVPDFLDRQQIAGILKKRLKNDWFLQVDASICYAKEPLPCYPLTDLDLKIDSPYNTYIYKGLPPTPIGSPGLEAIRAALSPKESTFWYYLSDPRSKKTVFAVTLEEHALNRTRYLVK